MTTDFPEVVQHRNLPKHLSQNSRETPCPSTSPLVNDTLLHKKKRLETASNTRDAMLERF